MGDHHVPSVLKDFAHVPNDVRPRPFRGHEIAGNGFMPPGDEGVPDDSREFTRYENPHLSSNATDTWERLP